MSTLKDIEHQVQQITTLTKQLPSRIPCGSPGDKIWVVLKGPKGETEWETFNKRFDSLFGEDCRDESGRLCYLSRGKYGMDAICAYITGVDFKSPGIPLDLVEIKLLRLYTEMVHLV
jgi:hypothetical protein